jgi:hypothetical protein
MERTEAMNILEQHDGQWKVTDRLALWKSEGPLLTDDILDKFAGLAIKVLQESNPELDLSMDKRFAANVYGRKRAYSQSMRAGVAETLALLGARPEALSTCSHGKAQSVSYQVVNQLLGSADSKRWASLNDVLPLLAEASPIAFLDAVGRASEMPDEPFSGVFAEESGGIMGRNYATGLLWALEALAWSPDYLVRVCGILANLAAVDPGGNYVNRPLHSLVSILLPWLPCTCAEMETRHSAIQCVIGDQPDVAWKALIQLLPKNYGSSSPTFKPKWQPFVPKDWKEGVTDDQRFEDEGFYADHALILAGNDPSKLIELLQFYFYIHPQFSNFMEDFRNRLLSNEILNLPEEKRLMLWSEITGRTSNHRKFSDSPAWQVPEEMLQQLDELADKLRPQEPSVRHRRLFSGRDFDLYDEKGNYEEQSQRLLDKRIEALKEVKQEGGNDALKNFVRSVESPQEVGNACGADDILADDAVFLPAMLESQNDAEYRFAVAYVWRRFHKNPTGWLNSIDRTKWTVKAKAEFFAVLPSVKLIWEMAENELGTNQSEYWKRARVHPYPEKLEGFDHAITQLIGNERPDMAIECFWLGHLWMGSYPELALQSLEAFNPSKNRIDTHAIQEAFSNLQKVDGIDNERLARMEWKFLALLNHHGGTRSLTLYRELAEQPKFFCDVIKLIYRPKHEIADKKVDNGDEEKPEIDETKATMARNAYALLSEWNYPPGVQRDGSFNGGQLNAWVDEVKQLCIKSGHWEVASNQIGEVLYYAPRDENGLWPESVCELLNSKENSECRQGLEIRIFNSRGAFSPSGGKEEIKIAERWEKVAEHAESKRFGRLGAILRNLGKSYREDAKRYIANCRNRYD